MDKNLEIIKQTAMEVLPGCRVLLFGSRARNTHRENSDYDIIVVIDKEMTAREKMPYKMEINNTLAKSKIYADVLVQSEKELVIKSQLIGHVIRYAMREAVNI